MRTIKFLAAAAALVGMAACCNNTPRQFMGFIEDASMNTITIKSLTADSVYTFSTQTADMTEANGLLLGSPVVVDYKGCLKDVTAVTKVATDPTYAAAIGRWTMPDPINPELVMGINLMVEGAAESINMATLPYQSWELQGEADKIILRGQSIGNSETADFVQTGILAKNAEGIWTLSIENTDVVLTKEAM